MTQQTLKYFVIRNEENSMCISRTSFCDFIINTFDLDSPYEFYDAEYAEKIRATFKIYQHELWIYKVEVITAETKFK